ncbi:MAG: MarR family transcriptional regulator [Thermoplasmataceae archaeon]
MTPTPEPDGVATENGGTASALFYSLKSVMEEFMFLQVEITRSSGLMVYQYALMRYLKTNGPQRLTDLSRFFHVRNPTVTGIIDTLQKRELVFREEDPMDRRASRVILSPEGNTLLNTIEERIISNLSEVVASIDKPSAVMICNFLDRIALSLKVSADKEVRGSENKCN